MKLRELLDSGEDDEATYQSWCKEHSWAFGNAYVMSDGVREISPGDSIDLLLPSVISGTRDIVELKRPSENVLLYDEGHRNFYFAAPVSRAIGQVHRYLDVLQEVAVHGRYMVEYADSALRHYELLGTHLKSIKGYEAYGAQQAAAAFG